MKVKRAGRRGPASRLAAWPTAAAVMRAAACLMLFSFAENLRALPPVSDPLPHLTWTDFFAKIESTGATFSDRMRALDGTRVVLRGYAVVDPRPPGGLYLTHFPEGKLHPDDEDTLPWDSVGVVWKKGRKVPPIPVQPSIEGTLRLGNRDLGTETVILVLEDAVPHLESSAKKATATTAAHASGRGLRGVPDR